MDGDFVPALGSARAGVLEGVFGCDFCGEGEGEEEGKEGEDCEAHFWGAGVGWMLVLIWGCVDR